MFHEDSANTGEPPTSRADCVRRSSELSTSVINPSSDFTVDSQSENAQTTGIMLQEGDSGYEASPSSTADNSSFNFDRVHADPEAEYDSVMTFHMDDELSQVCGEGERDNRVEVARVNCPHCGSLCICYYSISSVSNSSSISRLCDEGRNYRGSELSAGRSSSLPIAIPLRSNLASYLPLCTPMTRSNPITSGQENLEQRPYTLPLSWPSVTVLGTTQGRWWHISRPSWERVDGGESSRGQRAAPTRNRRRLIDSDASSLSSSEGDGPEDVFDAEEDSLPVLSANAFRLPAVRSSPRQETLPDLVQAHSSRRNRSVSINLPVPRELADRIIDVGRVLRRLSDEFSRRRQGAGASSRRFTIGDFV